MRASVCLAGLISSVARRIAPVPLVLCIAAAAPERQVFDPYAEGDMLSRRLLAGDVAALEQAMTPGFLAAVGGRAGLARMVEQLKAQAGQEVQVLRRAAYAEVGRISYYRVSRFERMPSVTTRWVFDRTGRVEAMTVRPTQAPAANSNTRSRSAAPFHLPFAAPAEGGHWYVAWGGDDQISNKHVAAPDQRFAYDFLVARGRAVFRGSGTRNEDHYCWNEPIYAPAAGTVVRAVGEIPDNAPGASDEKAPPPGNHVVIDHGKGAFSIIAHLRLGSVEVRQGQRVTAGTMVGRCGNSGRSDLPHLHYHLQDAASYGQGQGLPLTFRGYFVGGTYTAEGRPLRGDYLLPADVEAKP